MRGAFHRPAGRAGGRWREVTDGGWPAGPLPVHDARRIPEGAELAYDVCVVGTGAAGATAALALAGRGLRIAVLEGGGTAPDDVSTAFTDLDSSGRAVDQASRERWLGGTTNAWTGGKTTLDAIDLEARPWVPDSGWALDPARLRACYERAAVLLDRPPPSTYDGPAASPDDGVRFDEGDLRTLVFHEDARPLRFGELLRERLRPSDGVDVLTLANATEVLLDDAGTRAAGVAVATVTGRSFVVRAPVVVLGCGAIENARLLLASTSRRPSGLGNGHDVVGRYFQDHPKGFTGVLAVAPSARRLPASGYWPGRFTASGRLRWGIGLTEEAQRRAEVLNSYVRLEPSVLDQVPAGVAALRRAARGRVRGLDPGDLAGLAADAPALARLARFRLRNEGPIDLVRVRSFLEQQPLRASRVRLSERRDPLGRPLAAVDWRLSELDRRSVRVLHEALAGALRRHGLGDLQTALDDDSAVWGDLSDASHHAGTTRLGTDPRTSVTDPDGQVHDVPGLFVVGASLFPTSGYANPVFTIAATALHVADAVAAHVAPGPVAVTTGAGATGATGATGAIGIGTTGAAAPRGAANGAVSNGSAANGVAANGGAPSAPRALAGATPIDRPEAPVAGGPPSGGAAADGPRGRAAGPPLPAAASGPPAPGRPAPTPAGAAEARRWLAARRRARAVRPAASTAAAIVWTAPGRAELVPVEVPAPGQGQVSVLVEVSAVSLGTERARWRGLPGAAVSYPHQPGYSAAGTVHAVGPGVYDIEPGAPVAVWGAPHQSLVTVARAQVHPLGDGVAFDSAALVTLGAIAELGVARAGDVSGRSLAVVGAGAIGLLAQRIAAAEGAKPCAVVAASTAKDAVLAGDPAASAVPPAAVDDLAADVVIEATGAADGLDLAVRAAGRGGTVVVLGTTRAEAVALPLDLVSTRGLAVVGAHAGLLDAPGGTSGLDRRAAAQRFLDRVASGAVRVDDLVTAHADAGGAADLLDRLGGDRSQVVPVIDWWRLAPGVRVHPGGLEVPNPFRRGLRVPLGPDERAAGPAAAVVEHPAAPERPGSGAPAVAGAPSDAGAVAAAAQRAAARSGGGVRVQGTGPLADAVRSRLTPASGGDPRPGRTAAPGSGGAPAPAGLAPATARGAERVVVDVDPTAASVAAGLAGLGPDGVLLVAGRVGAVDVDVQSEVHKRGATIAGVPPDPGAAGQDG